MNNRLGDLSSEERAACLIAERILGAEAKAWDVNGRQGAVDAMLMLGDSRRAAFEVTLHAPDGAIGTDSVLGRSDNAWPAPGEWWWTIQVGAFRDIPELQKRYAGIAQLCEHVLRDRRSSTITVRTLQTRTSSGSSSVRHRT